eukprot:3280385-Rhodomonas_salina.1
MADGGKRGGEGLPRLYNKEAKTKCVPQEGRNASSLGYNEINYKAMMHFWDCQNPSMGQQQSYQYGSGQES